MGTANGGELTVGVGLQGKEEQRGKGGTTVTEQE